MQNKSGRDISEQMGELQRNQSQVLFTDEFSCNISMRPRYGYSEKGNKCAIQGIKKSGNISVIATISWDIWIIYCKY